ncbi:MAG: hypothetical protein ACREUE_12700 [Panacagrimonas sp.]
MEITELDIQNTVLELFARKGLVEGDVMWLSRLEQFWAETWLRRADLVAGLAHLCSEDLIVLEEQADGVTCVALTTAGELKAKSILAGGADYWRKYLREELLPSVRTRSETPNAGGRGRRDYEIESIPPFTR